MIEQRRGEDRGWLCWLAMRLSQLWDWVDKRQVDKHVVSLCILYGTISVTTWAMEYAKHGDRPGLEVAAIIAAVLFPYNALQAAAIAWYFKARSETSLIK